LALWTLKNGKKTIEVCEQKIAQKGSNAGLSFYVFFKNKNDDPKILMEAATCWVKVRVLNHLEKTTKIKRLAESGA
jgi:hypothetical protein